MGKRLPNHWAVMKIGLIRMSLLKKREITRRMGSIRPREQVVSLHFVFGLNLSKYSTFRPSLMAIIY